MFHSQTAYTFDWALAIQRNSEALRAVVATLFAMLGGDVLATRVTGRLHRAVLRILYPAESAVRRLIFIAARGLVVKAVPSRPLPKGPIGKGQGNSRPSFKLFDPRKNFTRRRTPVPRIHVFDYDPRVAAIFAARARSFAAHQPDDGLIDANRLVNRLQALKAALDNLPHQARRLVRARLRRQNIPGLKSKAPLRPGRPPGYRKRKTHEIDAILTECHGLAWDVLREDTS